LTSEANARFRHPDGPNPETPVNDALLTIGRVVAAHGLNGEIKVVLTTDRPERMHEIRRVYLDGNSTASRVTRLRLRGNDREAIVKLEGVNDRDSAEELRGATLKIRGNQLPPPDAGAFFHSQILGLQAQDEAGHPLGEVTEIIDAGEVDVYIVTDADGGQQLYPALQDVVLEIDPAAGRMVIRPQQYVGDDR
jgi:16S rRNA processing protein RimM